MWLLLSMPWLYILFWCYCVMCIPPHVSYGHFDPRYWRATSVVQIWNNFPIYVYGQTFVGMCTVHYVICWHSLVYKYLLFKRAGISLLFYWQLKYLDYSGDTWHMQRTNCHTAIFPLQHKSSQQGEGRESHDGEVYGRRSTSVWALRQFTEHLIYKLKICSDILL